MSKYKFYDQQYVAVDFVKLIGDSSIGYMTGKIVGCSTAEFPVMGAMYMVEIPRFEKSETYPFKVISVPEIFITPL